MKAASLNYLFESGIQQANYKTLSLKVRASDLLRAEIPNAPNLRQPSKNTIVRGIMQSIKDAGGQYEVPEPIHLSVKRAERYRLPGKAEKYGYTLDLREPSQAFKGDGILNGGHRMEAFRLLVFDGYSLDNVFVECKIYISLTNEQLQPLVESLNNSKSVSLVSKLNYGGEFDWVKETLPFPDYTIRYYENDNECGLPPKQSFCNIQTIYGLCKAVNHREFKGAGTAKQRHPYSLGSSDNSVIGKAANTRTLYHYPEIQKLVPDLIKIQTWVCQSIQNSHNRTPFHPSIKTDCKAIEYTHLPDGTILNLRIPPNVFTMPIISAYRPWLTEDFEWAFPLDKFGKDLASRLVTKYKQMLKQSEVRQGLSLNKLGVDPDLWDALYTLSRELRDEFMVKQPTTKSKVTKLARIA